MAINCINTCFMAMEEERNRENRSTSGTKQHMLFKIKERESCKQRDAQLLDNQISLSFLLFVF